MHKCKEVCQLWSVSLCELNVNMWPGFRFRNQEHCSLARASNLEWCSSWRGGVWFYAKLKSEEVCELCSVSEFELNVNMWAGILIQEATLQSGLDRYCDCQAGGTVFGAINVKVKSKYFFSVSEWDVNMWAGILIQEATLQSAGSPTDFEGWVGVWD